MVLRLSSILSLLVILMIACNNTKENAEELHFNVPDSQIDESLIHGFLDGYAIPHADEFPDPPLQEEFIKDRIETYKAAVQLEEAKAEEMIRFYLYNHIGSFYEQLIRFEPTSIDSAIQYREKALSIYKDDPRFRNDLSMIYSYLATGYMHRGDFDEGFTIYKDVIEEYADGGIGFYQNWYPVWNIEMLYQMVFEDIAEQNPHDPKMELVASYLDYLSNSYENVIGLAARIHLYKYYAKTEQEEKAVQLKQMIEDEFPIYQDNEFIWRMWVGVPEEIQRRLEMGEFRG